MQEAINILLLLVQDAWITNEPAPGAQQLNKSDE